MDMLVRSYDDFRMRTLVVASLALVSVTACARSGSRPIDAAPQDDAFAIDAFAIDAFAVDARETDAGTDASMDAGNDAGSDAASVDASGCPVNRMRCGASCVDTTSNGTNCGTCGHACAAGEMCVASVCGPPPSTWSTNATAFPCTVDATHVLLCPPAGVASSVWGTGEYTSDSSVCTAAVHAGRITLAAGGLIMIKMRAGRSAYTGTTRYGITTSSYGPWTCSYAVIAPTCAAADVPCMDVCSHDTSTDPGACGAACAICPAGSSCRAGACTCATAGQTFCNGACVDTSTSATNCGACGMACPATQVCMGGTCGCPPGRMICSGTTCTDTTTDAMNCGACNVSCPGGMTCAASTCGATPATWSTNATAHNCTTELGMSFTYGCPAMGTAATAWGTDTYTHDSSICTAAVHAGRITLAGGGVVRIMMAAGLSSYVGSTRNGITTSSYGPWSCSYVLP